MLECEWEKNIVCMLYLLGWSLSQIPSLGARQGLKKNELAKLNLGKYFVTSLGGFGILEAKLYPMDEKYLFIMSGKSEGLCDT